MKLSRRYLLGLLATSVLAVGSPSFAEAARFYVAVS